jgi:hypothetical protein
MSESDPGDFARAGCSYWTDTHNLFFLLSSFFIMSSVIFIFGLIGGTSTEVPSEN